MGRRRRKGGWGFRRADTETGLWLWLYCRDVEVQELERNIFCGPYSVIAFKCEREDESRICHYNGNHYVVTGAANKLVRIWDARVGQVRRDGDGFRMEYSRRLNSCLCSASAQFRGTQAPCAPCTLARTWCSAPVSTRLCAYGTSITASAALCFAGECWRPQPLSPPPLPPHTCSSSALLLQPQRLCAVPGC